MCLLFRHTLFGLSPVISAAFLLHERKFECMHDSFMAFIRKELPSLSNAKLSTLIVTDDERGICNAIDKQLCMSVAGITSLMLQSSRHGAKSAEIPSNLRKLFHQPTWNAYLEKYESPERNWSPAFLDYFDENLHNEVYYRN